MKKFFSLLLVFTLLICLLSACSLENLYNQFSDEDDEDEEVVTSPRNTEPAYEEPVETSNAPEETIAPVTPVTVTPAFGDPSETNIAGETRTGVYYNDFFGFKFVPPVDWMILDGDLLLEYNSYVLEEIEGTAYEHLSSQIEKGNTTTVMVASTLTEGTGVSNTNINIQPTPTGLDSVSPITFYTLMAETYQEQLVSMGLKDAQVTIGSTTFCGEVVYCLDISANGVFMKQLYFNKDGYTCVITATGATDAIADSILGFFVLLN